MIRLFAGLEIPEEVKDTLLDLEGGVPGARWIEADNLHLTLRFIGEIDEPLAADVDEALARIKARPFTVRLKSVGAFGGKNPHALWAGIENPEPLKHLADKCEQAVRAAGVDPEKRKFLPHVTVARLKGAPPGAVQDWIRRHGLFRAPDFEVTHFTLFSTALKHTGAVYTAERRYIL